MKNAWKNKNWVEQHNQVLVEFNGDEIKVDEKMANLLKNIWRLCIKTHTSCQSSMSSIPLGKEDVKLKRESLAYITFWSISDLSKFLSVLNDYFDGIRRDKIIPPENICVFYPNIIVDFSFPRPTVNFPSSTIPLYEEIFLKTICREIPLSAKVLALTKKLDKTLEDRVSS